jgi:transposase
MVRLYGTREVEAMADPIFKPCMQHQQMLLPPDISDLIDGNAMVRVVDAIVDSLDRSRLVSLYPGGGTSAYDPQMMLKVILYAYAKGIYSSRRIAQATREDICFMWLSGMHPLDHSTVNRFRTERIRPVFEDVFTDVISLLSEAGFVDLSVYFLDGTKIEADANKFTFVWTKSTKRYSENLRRKVHAHLSAIDDMEDEEEALAPAEPDAIDSENIREVADRINRRLERRPSDRDLKATKRMVEKDWLPRMERYEHQLEIAGKRGSYSKTDEDATFMRMKDDHMGNGQLKAAYNVQIGTSDQMIVDATVHQRPGDTACTIPHLEHLEERLGCLPGEIVADAGYGSEENYAYLERKGADAYVKHAEFFRECRNPGWRDDEMRPANWPYDGVRDSYTCPEGRTLTFTCERRTVSDMGYESHARVYTCVDCSDCPRRRACSRSGKTDFSRYIEVNTTRNFFRSRASEMLHTERGTYLRKKRSVDVETVFGDIKRNHRFTRFTLRGLDKVTLEFRLVAMGHNIRKLMGMIEGMERGMA